MANKYALQITSQAITADANGKSVGVAVPKGKTRFVCFVKISATDAETVTLGEGTDDLLVTTKDVTAFGAAANLAYPDKIDVENPLFSIAEEKYLILKGAGTKGTVTFVYFDE